MRNLLIYFIILFTFSSTLSASGTVVSSLEKKIYNSLNNNQISDSLKHYDDLFSITFKENNIILKKICLKLIEDVLKNANLNLKNEILIILDKIINIHLAKIILNAFNDSNEKIRNLAINIIVKFNNDLLYPDLSILLKKGDLNTKYSILEVIYKLKEKSFLPSILNLLDHEDVFIKAKVVETIGVLDPSDEEVNKLKKLLEHPNPKIRTSIIKAFCTIETHELDINEIIKDSNEEVRKSLLKWAALNPGSNADRIIRKELLSKDLKIYTLACLAALKSEDLISDVRWHKLIKSNSIPLRLASLKAMIKEKTIFDEEEIVLTFLNDKSPEIRKFMANYLLTTKDIMAESMIKEVLDNNLNIAKATLIDIWASNTNIKLNEKYIEKLIFENHAFIQAKSIFLLNRLSFDKQKHFISSLLNSNKINIRESVFKFLNYSKIKELYNLFYEQGLNDKSVFVQIALINGLNTLDDDKIISIFEKKIQSKFWAIRKEILSQINYIDNEEIKWDIVTKCIKDTNEYVRIEALKISSTLKDKKKILEIFSNALFDENEKVRQYVLKVLHTPKIDNKKEKIIDGKIKKQNTLEKKSDTVKNVEKQVKKKKKSKLFQWLNAGKKAEKQEKVNLSKKQTDVLNVDNENNQKVNKQNFEKKLNKLLKISNKNMADNVENLLLELGDEKSLSKIKNRLKSGAKDDKLKAIKQLGYLEDDSLIPIFRKQLINEKDLKVMFEISLAILKMLPNFEVR